MRRRVLLALCLVLCYSDLGAQQWPDSVRYATERLESAQIRRLPLTRSAEISSFLRSTILIGGYDAGFAGALGAIDGRIDGIPAVGLTSGRWLLHVPALSLETVEANASGASAEYQENVTLRYRTLAGSQGWNGYARASTDAGLPGSAGLARLEAGGGGSLASLLRVSGHVSAQAAQRTEFNQGVQAQAYEIDGVDTTVTIAVFGGDTRDIAIPNFVKVDGDRIPYSNWNELLANGRLDFLPTSATTLFVAGYYSRLQERAAFGGLCGQFCANVYNPTGQRATRDQASMFAIGLDQKMGGTTVLTIRLAQSNDQSIDDVLSAETAAGLDESGVGFGFGKFEFLVESTGFEIDEALIQRVISNQGERSPFPTEATEMNAASAFRMNPFGTLGTFLTSGVIGRYHFMEESRSFGSAVLSTNLARVHLTGGAEATRVSAREGDVGYRSSDARVWQEEPMMMSLFAQADADVSVGVLTAGVRMDSYDPNTEYSEIPGWIDPAAMQKAEKSTAVSPRFGFAMVRGPLQLRANYGASAEVPRLTSQFLTKNVDFFRFKNTMSGMIFSRPLSLITKTFLSVDAAVTIAQRWQAGARFQQHDTDNGVWLDIQPFEDPTNPGSTTHLTVPTNSGVFSATVAELSARYAIDSRRSARLAVTRQLRKFGEGPSEQEQRRTAVVGLLQMATPGSSIVGDLDVTLALRAHSPLESDMVTDPFGGSLVQVQSSWVSRFDVRVAKAVEVRGMQASLWIDGLRLLGSKASLERTQNDIDFEADRVLQMQTQLGAGQARDISLTTLPGAGPGIANAADLYLLRQVENRFGNGDQLFTLAEQAEAFTEALRYQSFINSPRSQGRRIQAGVEIRF